MVKCNRRFVSFCQLIQLLSVLCSCFEAALLARVLTKPLYDCLASYRHQFAVCDKFSPPAGLPGKWVKLNRPAQKALSAICNLREEDCIASVLPPRGNVRVALTTDASSYGWAAVAYVNGSTCDIAGPFPPEVPESNIMVKELYAVRAALHHLDAVLPHSHLVLSIDNQPAMYMLCKWSTRS